MNVTQVFLNWNQPALPAVADWLLEVLEKDDQSTAPERLVVVPSARAGRRLLEILVLKSQCLGTGDTPFLLSPPEIITIGRLPEKLLDLDGQIKVANEQETLFARVAAMRAMDASTLKQVFANLPSESDFLGWCTLAEELGELESELAGAEVGYAKFEEYCARQNLQSVKRWKVLSQISTATENLLEQSGFVSSLQARRDALKQGALRGDLEIILVSTVDLNSTTCKMLEQSGSKVLALIHAPESEGEGFGTFGQLLPEYWQQKNLEIDDDEIRIVTGASEQASEVAGILGTLSDVPDEAITVGLGDETLAPSIERSLERGGRKARHGTATTLAQSTVAELLRVLCAFWGEPRPEYFAALLRHPDIYEWLHRAKVLSRDGCVVSTWDEYYANHLPPLIHENSVALPETLRRVLAALRELLPDERQTSRPLDKWAPPVAQMLQKIYGEKEYSPGENSQLFAALQQFGKLLQSISESNDSPFTPQFGWCDMLRWVVKLAASMPLPPPSGEAAVELVGWLEVHLDDAPVLIVTSFNEGLIPDSTFAAPFLTDGLRSHFGLIDNRRRYARDAYLLAATRANRKKFGVVCSRRSLDNEPLQPSRLLFACDVDTAVRRAREFFREENEEVQRAPLLPVAQKSTLARFAKPQLLHEPPSQLRVTAFRDYLACPYRFYLKHICGLDVVGEPAAEMDGAVFGSLFHQVLSDFGRWAINEQSGLPSMDADALYAKLAELLRHNALRQFGRERLASVELQIHQLDRRLQQFAKAQVVEAENGWRIVCVETKIEKYFDVEDTQFRVYGRVDRIDYHPQEHTLRILDYKSSESRRTPEQTHRQKENGEIVWCDLQLPLYRSLAPMCPALGDKQFYDARIEVGYFCLPPQLNECGVEMADWSEEDYGTAGECAAGVMKNVHRQIFWPPSDVPPFDDGLGALCFDGLRERPALIQRNDGEPLILPISRTSTPANRSAT